VSATERQAVDLLVRVLGATVVGTTTQQVVLDDDEAGHRADKEPSAHDAGARKASQQRDRRQRGEYEGRGQRPTVSPPVFGHDRAVPALTSSQASDGLVDRAARQDFGRWLAGAASAGECVRPVRLRPSMFRADPNTGELVPTPAELPDAPDGVLYKPCGDRRASVCPACAERYRRDTWQLIAAGLRGGKGVPAEVAGHPAVFLTLTAPSFGMVHTRRTASTGRVLPCRPRRKPAPCPHGVDLRCSRHHDQDESVLGLPFCLDCYHHEAQVVWNAHVGELWRRTVIGLRRQLTRVARNRGTTVRLSYAKVAEFQRRGVVHLHALLRLDGIDPADRERIIPPAGVELGDLVDAIRYSAARTDFATELHTDRGRSWRINWGEQLDVRPLRLRGDGDLSDRVVVAYLAKYAIKSTESTGHLSKRLTASTVDYYADPHTHVGRLIDACWTLSGAEGWDGLRRWAHMLGFGGHFGTRSRRYSTTLRALRRARRTWRRRELVEAREHTEDTTLVVGSWTYAGTGWRTNADALLAASAAARARERRRVGREELADIERRNNQ
jgi:hypothetical protein